MKRKMHYAGFNNVAQIHTYRNYYDIEQMVKNRMKTAPQFVDNIELEAELRGHNGCVNCLEWSDNGRILASASDDFHVMLWDPFRHRVIYDLETPHQGNIFSVKFLPDLDNSTVATGAADCKIFVYDINHDKGNPIRKCVCHTQRVKRLATSEKHLHLFWSAAEDGVVLQHDMRMNHTCGIQDANVLINLKNHICGIPEVKCIAINPMRPELLAIGANDVYVRMYDRRMISLTRIIPLIEIKDGESRGDNIDKGCVTYFSPGHLSSKEPYCQALFNHNAVTYVTFSPDGNELLANMGSEHIYLYNINNNTKPVFLELPKLMQPAVNGTNGTKPEGKTKHKLPPEVDQLKKEGNANLEQDKYLQAIQKYTLAIRKAQNKDCSILYLNRATALIKRSWYGDVYAAIRDCHTALKLDPHYVKAHFRLARALLKLGQLQEAQECLEELTKRFPSYVSNPGVRMLERDIEAVMEKQREQQQDRQQLDADQYSNKEKYWRSMAVDYEDRFVGHCNTKTDIKEANFFGDSNYIVAGSDDGNFFIWDRSSGMITSIYQADELIVNCVQPHPYICLLATSGIDHEVRLWSPQSTEKLDSVHKVRVTESAIHENQHRMLSDPFDTLAPGQAICRTS